MATVKLSNRVLGKIEGLLACIDPDVDFDTLHDVMGLVYVETFGSHKGLELLDSWYCKSSEYPGFDALADMWLGYDNDEVRYFGMGRLAYLASEGLKAKPEPKTKADSSSAKAK